MPFGDKILIKRVALDHPIIHVKVLPDGRANYEIAKADSTAGETPADTAASKFNVQLKEYSITDCHVIYDDQSLPKLMDLAVRAGGREIDD